MLKYRLSLIILAGLSFVMAHEFGHYVVAELFGLKPEFVIGRMPDAGISGFSIGVSHMQASNMVGGFVILGATALPLAILLLLVFSAKVFSSEDFMLVAKIYFILILINLIPIPGMESLDANRLLLKIFGS